jgi:hypothetical protein
VAATTQARLLVWSLLKSWHLPALPCWRPACQPAPDRAPNADRASARAPTAPRTRGAARACGPARARGPAGTQARRPWHAGAAPLAPARGAAGTRDTGPAGKRARPQRGAAEARARPRWHACAAPPAGTRARRRWCASAAQAPRTGRSDALQCLARAAPPPTQRGRYRSPPAAIGRRRGGRPAQPRNRAPKGAGLARPWGPRSAATAPAGPISVPACSYRASPKRAARPSQKPSRERGRGSPPQS